MYSHKNISIYTFVSILSIFEAFVQLMLCVLYFYKVLLKNILLIGDLSERLGHFWNIYIPLSSTDISPAKSVLECRDIIDSLYICTRIVALNDAFQGNRPKKYMGNNVRGKGSMENYPPKKKKKNWRYFGKCISALHEKILFSLIFFVILTI